VRVLLTAKEMVHYRQVVEMTRKEWAEIKAAQPDEAAGIISDWIDKRDVHDGDGIDVDDFEAEVVDERGKPVEPADYYGC